MKISYTISITYIAILCKICLHVNADSIYKGPILPSEYTTTNAVVSVKSPPCSSDCPVDYIPSNGSCKKCSAGTQSPCGSTRCSSCPAGQFNEAGSGLGCQNCAAGQFTASPLSASCNLCPAGTYSGSGKLYCTSCPVGQYQSLKGQSACINCPSGTTTSSPKAIKLDDCIPFPSSIPSPSSPFSTLTDAPVSILLPTPTIAAPTKTSLPSTISPVLRISAHPLYISEIVHDK